MTKLKADGWSTQLASDIHRDSLSLELLDPFEDGTPPRHGA